MNSTPGAAELPYFDDAQEAILMRLEQAWRAGAPPELARFAPRGASVEFLKELGLIDLERRFSRGLPCAVEDYLKAFPALARDDAALELVLAELAQRHRHGRAASLAEYRRRFPCLEGRLVQAFGSADAGPRVLAGRCPSCGRKLTYRDKEVGKIVKCEGCGRLLRIPAASGRRT